MKALEVENGLQQPIAGGVAVEHGEQIGPNRRAYLRGAGHMFGEGLTNDWIRRFRAIEPLRETVADNAFQAVLGQHRAID